LDKILQTEWSLVFADNIFSPHAYAIAERLKKEHNVPYLFFSPSGQLAAHICEETALSKLLLFEVPNTNYLKPKKFSMKNKHPVET
jgi:hypothetical protein